LNGIPGILSEAIKTAASLLILACAIAERYQLQLRAKAFLVKRHCLPAVSVKDEIGVDFLHGPLHFYDELNYRQLAMRAEI
jgi:hypothetical protein